MALTTGLPTPGATIGKFDSIMRWVAPGIGFLIGVGVGWIFPLPTIVKKVLVKAGMKEGGDLNLIATLISGFLFLAIGGAIVMKFDNPVMGVIGGLLAGIGASALWYGFTIM